ncbi:FAD-dependent oxidoreductase [Nocardia sp. NPDC050718]|uniref:hydroxysqualene dehydroxylase n=1 Tax=Nocardia sp. NPDC050718 TaxID=3155788 RepID=UPI0033DB789D
MGITWQSARRGFLRSTNRRAAAAPGGRTVAVFGAGLAGLTTAHELAERGFALTVYERLGAAGGKCRSIVSDRALPGEHGFHTFFGCHRDLPDTLRRIPFRRNRDGVYDNLVRVDAATIAGMGRADSTAALPFPLPSRQSPRTPRQFADSFASVFETLFRLLPHEALFAAERLAVYISSCEERRLGQWERMSWSEFAGLDNASAEYHRFLGDGFLRTLMATQARACSAHSIGLTGEDFVRSLLNPDDDRDDRVLNGPTSATFIDPWVTHLRSLGVTFAFGAQLSGFDTDGAHLRAATVTDHTGARHRVEADYYVCAIPPDKATAVFTADVLAADPRLDGVSWLPSMGMVGVQFFLRRRADLATGHVAYVDSPWGLTSIGQAPYRRTSVSDPGTPDVSYDGAGFLPKPGSWADRPDATTAIDNLFLAGDWIRTPANVACMESANEGGRLAANAVLHVSGSAAGRVPITPRFRMPLWEPLELADSALYHAGQPHAFDLTDRRYPVR